MNQFQGFSQTELLRIVRGLLRSFRMDDAESILISIGKNKNTILDINYTDYKNSALLLKYQLDDLQNAYSHGTLSYDEYSLNKNKIAQQLLFLVNKIGQDMKAAEEVMDSKTEESEEIIVEYIIEVDGDLNDLSFIAQTKLIEEIRFMLMRRKTIKIRRIEKGSIKITLELSLKEAKMLSELLYMNKNKLDTANLLDSYIGSIIELDDRDFYINESEALKLIDLIETLRMSDLDIAIELLTVLTGRKINSRYVIPENVALPNY